jgi:hypothetical protein
MAGKIIADIIEAPAGRISLNVANVTVASINASGLYTSTGNLLITQANQIGRAALPAGSVLQVVQANLPTGFSTSSSSATDTGLSASITPSSASNKVLAILSAEGGQSNSGRSCFYTIVRGTTTIKTRDNLQAGPTNVQMPLVLMELDSPNTTSSVTYKIQMRTDGAGTVSMIASGTQTSSLILMEIAG